MAEIDHQDVWQRTRIAIVTVSSSKESADREMQNAISYLQSNPEWEMLEQYKEYL